MRAVVVDKFLPLPADSGGKRRSLALVQRLASRLPVTLCGFARGGEDLDGLRALGVDVRAVPWEPSAGRLPGGLRQTGSATSARFWDVRLAAAVGQACSADDLLIVEYTQLARYARAVPAAHRVLDMHNVESDLVDSYGRSAGSGRALVAKVEAAALRRLESRAGRDFDQVVCVSDRDASLLSARGVPALVCGNGWDPRAAPLASSDEPLVIFVALLSWAPNVDAACWWATKVWPLVRRQLPTARLALVGKDPAPAVRALQCDDVQVTGTVASVEPWLRRAQVAVAPLRSGGGSRLKVLEALDASRPVVATRIGLEGLEDLEGEGAVVADDPGDLADAVVALLTDPQRAAELGRRGAQAVRQRHSWDATWQPLLSSLEGVGLPPA